MSGLRQFSRNWRWLQEQGLWGWGPLLALLLFTAAILILEARTSHPSVDRLEQELWAEWVKRITWPGDMSLADLAGRNDRDAMEAMLGEYAKILQENGKNHLLYTEVKSFAIDGLRIKFLAPQMNDPLDLDMVPWKEQTIRLSPDHDLTITYRPLFHVGGLSRLNTISKFEVWHAAAKCLVAVLVLTALAGALINLGRLHHHHESLKHQQALLDFGRQMCHELRNGLWGFSNTGEGQCILLERLEHYIQVYGLVLEQTCARAGLSDGQVALLRLRLRKALAAEGVNPETDLRDLMGAALTGQARLEHFRRYISLLVTELDRSLVEAPTQGQHGPVSPVEAWSEACDLLSMRLESHGVRHREELAEPAALVLGDRHLLVQIFINLLKNATENMAALCIERLVNFRVETESDVVRCTVGNPGPRIPPDVLARLFHEKVSTKDGPNRGTGLLFVRDAILRMGGQIHVSSDGDGTCFNLTLPRARPEALLANPKPLSQPN
jgi:signal transduction histidine kinase